MKDNEVKVKSTESVLIIMHMVISTMASGLMVKKMVKVS